jgi:hypothetical protein
VTDQPDETVPDTEPAAVPEDAPESSKGRKRAFIGLAVVAAVVALGVAALVFFVLDADGPSEVVDDYFQALKDADINGVRDYLCEAERADAAVGADADAQAALSEMVADLKWDVTGEDVKGDEAIVTVELTGLGGEGQPFPFSLVKESGDWKLCGNAF